MNTGEDESSSGLNGRLRPRKTTIPSPQSNKIVRKPDGKATQDRPKRTSTPSKASSKPDDLSHKSDLSNVLQLLCPYCDRKFASKQSISKHVRRIHFSNAKQNFVFSCLFCKHTVPDSNEVIRHMVDSHPNQYFACLDCHTRFSSTSELAEHKLNVCEKHKMSYRNKLRQKTSPGTKKNQKLISVVDKDKGYIDSNRFNGIVISCELKPSQAIDNADIEDNITTNLILPPNKNLGTSADIEKNAVIVLDDLQWSKRMPANFSFHNTDADQILSRLGVVHRSPRTSEFTKKDWLKNLDESTQKFEKCFDTGFYSKVASNVQENLSKFLDGSFNFNPDADSTIKTRKLKNSVVINTAEGFPILLAGDQFSRTTFDGYIPRTIAPKHKWKWDNEKNPINPDDIKRDSHVNNCIITLVSSLDIWTQLCMRRKFEDKFSIAPLEKKTEKQNAISKELKEILESREIPSTSSYVLKLVSKPIPSGDSVDFPASLGLKPATPTYDLQPAVLSGEWVRPRCYVCCACGAQTRDSRGLSSHITTHHPNAQVQHYEIAGELLLNADILKHLYVPPSLLNNRTRPLRGFRECTKCKKSISLEDLHQHMLDCAGDTPTVRRKCRYRPFGVRRRRPRLPDNTIRKKIRKDMRRQTRQTRQKNLMRPRPKIRTEVGDAESIRKMIADLPAKRHRAMVTPVNPILRPRKKIDQQRNKLILKRRTTKISTRNQQTARNINERLRSEPSNEDNNDQSSKDDDDKPLKSRLKRLLTKTSRQSETLKRKVALSRAKRRAQLKEQANITEDEEPKVVEKPPVDTAAGSGSSTEQLSIGNTPQKIDVNNSPYNTRDHSSRHRSNNNNSNDQQRPGSSGQDGNMNNAFMPAPNEPLKHSIARLTSDMEMYDKSLQFHHEMFLLQQECNNLNQHVPSGQQRLFENEAVVTKLDKPPLHFQQRGLLDSITFQRNKFNKPRKGLNDCIAMLKNKLVDPIIPTPSAHSVDCGSDEPLIFQSATTNRRLSSTEYQMQINTRPAEIFSRHNFIHDRLFQLRNESNLIHQGYADLPLHFLSAQNLYEIPPRRGKLEKVKSPKQKQCPPKREITRRRSTRAEKDNTRHKYVIPPNIELIPHNSTENYSAKVSPSYKLDSSHCQNRVNNDTNKSNVNHAGVPRKQSSEQQDLEIVRSTLEIQPRRISNDANLFEINQAETVTQPLIKPVDASLLSSPKQAEACPQSQSKQRDIYKQLQTKQTDTYTQTQLKPTEVYTQSEQKQQEVYTQSQPKQIEVFKQSQPNQTEAYTQSQINQAETYIQSQIPNQNPSTVYTESSFHKNIPDIFPEREVTRIVISRDIYSESNFNRTDLPLIRTNSNTSVLEPSLPVPLDLTVNISDNFDASKKQNNSYDSNDYDSYETLDLSNKSVDLLRDDLVVDDVVDGVVDLRVNASQKISQNDLELSTKNNDVESATDLTIKTLEMENTPTDLTVRKQGDVYEYDQIDIDYDCVQDLSRHRKNDCNKHSQILSQTEDIIDQDVPTDLSGKKVKEVTSIIPTISPENMKDDVCVNEKTNIIIPADLSTRKEVKIQRNEQESVNEEAFVVDENIEMEIDVERSQDSYDEMQSYTRSRSEHFNDSSLHSYSNVDPLTLPKQKFNDILTEPTTVVNCSNSQIVSKMTATDPVQSFSTAKMSTTATLDSSTLKSDVSSKEKPENILLCQSESPLPLYTMSNTAPIPRSKYESTMPVYTLANACITMSKIEPSNIAPNIDTTFSVLEKSTASNEPPCSITETLVSSENYSTLMNCNLDTSSTKSVSCSDTSVDPQNASSNIKTTVALTVVSEDSASINDKNSKNLDIDPETAKKIALLPKELVEILGTMPVDHRNQLLNVLPQYVSKSPTAAQPRDNSVMPETLCSAVKKSTLTCQTNVATNFIGPEQTHNNVEIKPLASLKVINESATFERYNTFVPNVSEVDEIRIIDLTEDDSPAETKIKNNPDKYSDIVPVITEPIITKPNKSKVNDQTASLRAVRIKTPSERNKSTCMENQILKASVEQQFKSNIQTVQDLEVSVEKSSELDKTMAIQQAEVSSTQHNTTSSGKYPLAISPASTESSSDEASKNMLQQNPISAVCIEAEKTNEQIYNIPLPQSKVSSSVSRKERNGFHDEPVVDKDSRNTSSVVDSPVQTVDHDHQLCSPKNPHTLSTIESTSESTAACGAPESAKCLSQIEANTLDEDDSDDDISLAAIVKQKQRDLRKHEDVIDNLEMGSKKKKIKKTKKSGRKISHRTSNECRHLGGNVAEQSEVISLKDTENNEKNLINQDNNQNFNAQSESLIESTKCESQPEIVNQPNSQCLVKNTEKDDVLESDKITMLESDKITSETKSSEQVVPKIMQLIDQDNSTVASYKGTEKFDKTEIALDIVRKKTKGKKHLVLESTEKGGTNGKISDLAEVSKTEKVKLKYKNFKEDDEIAVCKKDVSLCCIQDEDKSKAETSENTCNNVTTSTSMSDLIIDERLCINLPDVKLVSSNIVTDLQQDKKMAFVKTAKSIEVHSNQDGESMQEVASKDDLMTTPLRRSRRGKSLFMESHSIEKEIINNSEIIIEHKTPLTKKQLIFSKLLLDEGKPDQATYSNSEKVDRDKTEGLLKNDAFLNVSDVSKITGIDNLDTISEKNKALKRRKSPNNIRKSKKKKSIEDYHSQTIDIAESHTHNDPIIHVDSVETTTSSNPESRPMLLIDKLEDKKCANKNECKPFEVESNAKSDEKLLSSSEKRKIDNLLSSDLSRSSKAKKSKTLKGVKSDDDIKEVVNTEKNVDTSVSGPRMTCYNNPVPARRGRSKSVVVRSSVIDLYDPYDIDLEDMIEQHESFRRKKKSSEQKPCISQKKSKTSSIATKDSCKTVTEKDTTKEAEKIIPKDKTVLSDSDDSSKSDVPLQKYVEEKEKKNFDLEITPMQKKNVTENLRDSKSDDTKDIKYIETTSGDASSVTEYEAEQKLRSEQFMESFGFFSERKPRKSNLLATKKISETFHINNESDDMYFGFKERSSKKVTQIEKDIKKSVENELQKLPQPSTSKKAAKRGRKKKSCTKILPSYCSVCKKEFRRPDNYLRHQMTLLHISKLSEVEMKVKTVPVHEEPNYLMAYKQYLERFKKLTDKLSKLKRRNPKAASKIVLPTMQEILSDVNRTVREQQLSQRDLSHDEELFIDCCELLKESHNGDKANTSDIKSSMSGLDHLENAINASFSNDYESNDDDVDSITAQNILDSEEVRNLENDLISGLKEAAKATRKSCNIEYQSSMDKLTTESENHNDIFSSNNEAHSHFEIVDFDIPEKPRSSKVKKHCSSTEFIQIKEKMYPDIIDDIDMFEDKFDKIKRKCRSQAAAAKQTPPTVELCTSHRARRKSEKKRVKRNSKKTRHQSTQVPTKGALKGFDGIKVSIPTSDINLSAIVPVAESSPKKKKKTSSKKKRELKDSESTSKFDGDHRGKDSVVGQNKKLDVYEFMDNEDAELFEFRPSTLMERFKSISNKEIPNTSKFTSVVEDNTSESGSDGDDFVYMSDDYVCSDDETENSLLSCENGNVKLGNDIKKNVTPQKRKDVVEKNAVMGKIFKHNAVRTEKKITVPKEPAKPKANLDQLFDSLLEEEPSTSMLNSELDSPGKDGEPPRRKHMDTESKYDSDLVDEFDGSDDDKFSSPKKVSSLSPDKTEYIVSPTSKKRATSTSRDNSKDPQKDEALLKNHLSETDYKPSVTKKLDSSSSLTDYGPSTSKKYSNPLEKDFSYDPVPINKAEEMTHQHSDPKLLNPGEANTSKHDEVITSSGGTKSPTKKLEKSVTSSYDYGTDVYDQSVFDEAGVARQRARRKCTVGKQNVLAESWSSESEPDGGPPRPNSAESVVGGSGRKKKGRKKDGQQLSGRRGNNRQVTFKRIDVESRVNSSNRNTLSNVSGSGHSGAVDDGERPGPSGLGSAAAVPSTSAAAAAAAAAAMPAPSTSQAPGTGGQKGRPRSVAYYWSSEGDDEQEHQQQHGWIVGDSHKKLVTMLAHAKGRKRNNDDKRHLVE